MATVTRRIEVCDCHREFDRPIVARVRIAPDGERLRTVAFCEEGYSLMAQILEMIREKSTQTDGRRPNRKVTLDQIEEIKAKRGTKRTAKAAAPARRGRKATESASKA